MTAAAVMMQVVSQLDSPEMGNGSSDGSASPPHSGAQQAELQLAAAWQVSLLILCPATLTALALPCNSPPHPATDLSAFMCAVVHSVCTLWCMC